MSDIARVAAANSTPEFQAGYANGYRRGQAELTGHYSRALDEIYAHRRAAAYEAAQALQGILRFRTLPVGARVHTQQLIHRLLQTARGALLCAYADVTTSAVSEAMEIAGGNRSLTRADWEKLTLPD